jgi:hypothetical protein
MEWIKYKKGETQPTEYGRYLVYLEKLNLWGEEVWNGSGWSHNNNLISHFTIIKTP